MWLWYSCGHFRIRWLFQWPLYRRTSPWKVNNVNKIRKKCSKIQTKFEPRKKENARHFNFYCTHPPMKRRFRKTSSSPDEWKNFSLKIIQLKCSSIAETAVSCCDRFDWLIIITFSIAILHSICLTKHENFTWFGFSTSYATKTDKRTFSKLSSEFFSSRSHSANVSLQKQEIRMRLVDFLRPQRRQAHGPLLRRHDLELLCRPAGGQRAASRRWFIPAELHSQCEWVLHFLS